MAQYKFLLIATLLLFASYLSIANGKDGVPEPPELEEPKDRNEGLGEGPRIPEQVGESGGDYQGLKVLRETPNGVDTVVFTFRAFPVPRVRVRYFDGDINATDAEDNAVEAKLELVTQIPTFFYFINGDDDPAFNQSTDTVTKIFNLRRDNADSWKPISQEQWIVDYVQVYKFQLCRKTLDFCLVAFVANDSVTVDGFDLTPDTAKFNIVFTATQEVTLSAEERLAFVLKIRHFDGLEVEDRSEENEEKQLAGEVENRNDLTIGIEGEDVAGFLNWEKFVTLTSWVTGTAQTSVAAIYSTNDDFLSAVDREKPSDPAAGPLSLSNIGNDDQETFPPTREDPAVIDRLTGSKVYIFAIDSPLQQIDKIVWDPTPGVTAASTALLGSGTTETTTNTETTTSTASSSVFAASLSFQVVFVLLAILALFL